MLSNLKSNFILKKLFDFLENKRCLKIISYNKSFQSKLSKDINDFKYASNIYLKFEDKGKVKEYDKYNDNLKFEGEYKNKKRNGFGKEYYEGKLIFEGQYKDGLKNGPGKKYDDKNGKLIFEGIYLNGKEWEGEGQIKESDGIFVYYKYYGKITEGKINGFGKKVDNKSYIDYEGNFIKGKKWGHSKEFHNSKLVFEGEFSNDKRNEYGIEYDIEGNVIFEGQFLDGQRWEGFGKEKNKDKEELFEGEYKNGKRNGKGKEYYFDAYKEKKIIKFNGNYLNGERSGKGIEYYKNGKIKFVGDFLKGSYNNGKGYNIERDEIFEIKNGEGNIKIYNYLNKIEFEGEYKNYRFWNGKEFIYDNYSFEKLEYEFFYKEGDIVRINEYDHQTGNLKFEGEYINGILNKGKEYKDNILIFEGEYFSEKKFENKEQFFIEYKYFLYPRKRKKGKEYNIWNNKLKYEGDYLEGEKTGYGKIYNKEGILIYEGELLNGKKRGKGKSYDEKENFIIEDDINEGGDYIVGEKTGFGKIYNKEDILIYEGELLNGLKHGKGKLYDEKGNLKIEGDFINDKEDYKNGFIKEYEKGILSTETEYRDKVPIRAKHYNEKGVLILDYKDKWIKTYYDNGNLKDEGDYYYGYIGILKEYYENGKLSFEGEAKDSKKWNGKVYDENGEIIEEIKDGKSLKNNDKDKKEEKEEEKEKVEEKKDRDKEKNGKENIEEEKKKEKNEEEEKEEENRNEENEKEEKKDKEEKKKSQNKINFEGEYYDGEYWTGKLKEYYDNGNIKLEAEYLYGEINGNYKSYNEEGIIKSEEEYINGKKLGKCKYYDKGILSFEREPLIFGQMLKIKEYYDNGSIKYDGEGDYEGNRVGKGKLYSKEGEILFEGEFLDNKYMKEKKRKRYFGNNISIESDGDEDLKSVKKDNLYNGILNGRGKEYYNLNKDDKNNNNKDLIYEGEFYNGMFNGEGKLYFENGNIIFEGKFLNDEPFEGTIKIYDETGKIIGENKLKYGKSNGPIWLKTCYEEFEGEDIDDKHWNGKYKVFNQKDEIKINGEIKNGSFNGIAKIENKEGELIEVEYKNGKIWTGNTEDFKKDIFFYFNSVPFDRTDTYYFKGDFLEGKRWKGEGKELYPNKMVEFEGEYDKGERIKGIEWYEDGLIKYVGDYLDGKYYNGYAFNETGEEIYEIKEGKGLPKEFEKYGYRYEGEYLNGIKNGKGKEYYKERLIFEGEYLNGKRRKGKEYHITDGYLLFEGEYLNGERNGKGKEYYQNGKIKFEGEYYDSRINKKGKEYNIEGELIREGEFKDDELWIGKKYPTIHDKNEEEYLYGKKHGKVKKYIIYHFDNIPQFEGEYLDGKKIKGRYDDEDEYTFEGEYMDDNEFKGKQYNFGKFTFEGELYKRKFWTGKKYRKDSDDRYEGDYLYGKKCGKWKEYDYDGFLEYEGKINEFMKYRKGKWFNEGKLIFEGEYFEDKKYKGKKKKYDNDELKGEYEYSLGKKNGKAIEYFKGGNIRFEGEFLNGRKWNGKGYEPHGELIYEIKNGKGDIKEFDFDGNEK